MYFPQDMDGSSVPLPPNFLSDQSHRWPDQLQQQQHQQQQQQQQQYNISAVAPVAQTTCSLPVQPPPIAASPASNAITDSRLQQLQQLQRRQAELMAQSFQQNQQQNNNNHRLQQSCQPRQPQQLQHLPYPQPEQQQQQRPVPASAAAAAPVVGPSCSPRSRARQYEAAAAEMLRQRQQQQQSQQQRQQQQQQQQQQAQQQARVSYQYQQQHPLAMPQLMSGVGVPVPPTFEDGMHHAVLSSSSFAPFPSALPTGAAPATEEAAPASSGPAGAPAGCGAPAPAAPSSATGRRDWQKLRANDVRVKDVRVKIRKKIEHYVATCMLGNMSTDKASTSAAAKVPFRRVLSAKLESKLYDSSPTFEQYSDTTTLEARLKILAMQVGKRIEANQCHKPASDGPNATSAERSTRKRQRPTGAEDGGDVSGDGSSGGVPDDEQNAPPSANNKRLRTSNALRSCLGADKYDELMRLVGEVRNIRRTSDVWMCAKATGTTCGGGGGGGGDASSRRNFTPESLEEAEAILNGGGGGAQGHETSPGEPERDDSGSAAACNDSAVTVDRPGSPEEKTLVESMPRALTAIYFGTRLVEAEATVRAPQYGAGGASSPQLRRRVQRFDWDGLLEEARRNLRAFRALEEETKADERGGPPCGGVAGRRFAEVCTLSGGCRSEPIDLGGVAA